MCESAPLAGEPDLVRIRSMDGIERDSHDVIPNRPHGRFELHLSRPSKEVRAWPDSDGGIPQR